jgi:predicted  nucleic acid-binding Zn-ribbon protein
MTQPLTLESLIGFHREVIAPGLQRIVATLEGHTALHRETHAHLDGIDQKLESLETEYQAIRAALERLERRVAMVEVRVGKLEERVTRVEDRAIAIQQTLDHASLQAELRVLEERLLDLERVVAALKREI